MRIVQVTCSYLPYKIGGTEIYVNNLSKKLKEYGHDVFVVYIDSFYSKNKQDILTYEYSFEGMPVFVIKKNTYKQKTKDLYISNSLEFNDAFQQYIKKINPDIIHFHHFSSVDIIYMMRIAHAFSIPIIFTYHTPNMTCGNGYMLYLKKIPCDGYLDYKRCLICIQVTHGVPYPLAYFWANLPIFFSKGLSRIISFFNLKGKFFTWLQLAYLNTERIKITKEALSLVDCFIVFCNWSFQVLINNSVFKEKIILSSHGIEKIYVETIKEKNNTLKLGYIGRISYVKGIDILIKAIRQVPKNYDIELYIYGNPQDISEIKYLKKLKRIAFNDKRIKFKGRLDHKDRFNILGNFDILIIPSRWLETGPLVLWEAWSVGVPVIGTKLGGIAELVKEEKGGVLFESENYQELADIIKNIYKDRKILFRLKSSIPKVKLFEETTRGIHDLYINCKNQYA